VTGRPPYILQIVVFASGPDALLRSGRAPVGPLIKAEKDLLKLVHSSVGEEQSRVVVRDQG